jgi:hypothetical protein
MSATELIEELKAMPAHERETVFATLAQDSEWRKDILDLVTIAERKNEPTRPLDDVLKGVKIRV